MTQGAEKHANFFWGDDLNSARRGGNQPVLILKIICLEKRKFCRFPYFLHESYLDE
jgi:hypothetical protein